MALPWEENYQTESAPAPAPKKVVVPAVAMPLPAASVPAPNPNAALVAAFQTRNASAPAAAAAPVAAIAPAAAAPAMPALPPPPKIQPGEAPVNFKRRLSDYYQNIEKMKLEAAAPKATADSATFDAKAQKLRNFEASLQAYKDELGKDLTVFPTEIPLVPSQGMAIPLPVGGDTARMKSKFTTVLMGLKDAYDLGALTGPDMPIILSQLTNPASVSGMLHSKSAFDEQVKVLEDIVKTSKDTLESTYKRKINYGPSGAQSQGSDPLMLRRR